MEHPICFTHRTKLIFDVVEDLDEERGGGFQLTFLWKQRLWGFCWLFISSL